jgi:hypothetical protein
LNSFLIRELFVFFTSAAESAKIVSLSGIFLSGRMPSGRVSFGANGLKNYGPYSAVTERAE